jgi:hypothetical protein
VTGIFTFGNTSSVPLEYLTSAMILGSIAVLAWQRGIKVSRYEVAGLLACCALFLVVPKDWNSVGVADRRLIAAIVLMGVIFVRGPSANKHRSARAVTMVLLAIIALKALLIMYLWTPLKEMDGIYTAIARAIPAKAVVLFVPPVEEQRADATERAKRFLTAVSHLSPLPVEDVSVFNHHPHLIMHSLLGKDVLPTQAFTNFWMKKRPEFRDLPNTATALTRSDIARVLAKISVGSVSHVVSHIDIRPLLPPGASAEEQRQVGPVTLYVVTRSY